jgi:hypothetical protein
MHVIRDVIVSKSVSLLLFYCVTMPPRKPWESKTCLHHLFGGGAFLFFFFSFVEEYLWRKEIVAEPVCVFFFTLVVWDFIAPAFLNCGVPDFYRSLRKLVACYENMMMGRLVACSG